MLRNKGRRGRQGEGETGSEKQKGREGDRNLGQTAESHETE